MAGKKGKKGKKGKLVRSGHSNPHKIAEFNDLSAGASIDANAKGIREAITALRQTLVTDFQIPAGYISIIRIQPPKASSDILSASCGCGCS